MKNILGKGTLSEESSEEEEFQIYDIESGEFQKTRVKSKVVFLLDHLLRSVRSIEEFSTQPDPKKERLSSWLLLSLSSYNSL